MLEIEQPAKKHLPDFSYGDKITIRHLLSHSAGLPNPMQLNWIHLAKDHETFNSDLFFRKIASRNSTIRWTPNDRFSYSNLGYIILGQVIEAVSGMRYELFIKKNIFHKLNLDKTDIGFTIPGPTKHATGYHPRFSLSNLMLGLLLDRPKFMSTPKGRWVPFNSFYVNGAAYGGLIGTMNALMKYAQELLEPQGNLISDRARTQLFRENITNDGKSTGMCLSWFKGSLNGETYFAHAGGGGGYYSEIRLYPNLDRGSVVLLNRTGFRDERFLDHVDKYFIG